MSLKSNYDLHIRDIYCEKKLNFHFNKFHKGRFISIKAVSINFFHFQIPTVFFNVEFKFGNHFGL